MEASNSTSRKSIIFKIAEGETWTCDKHSQSKIFYCLEHSVPFCPSCLKEKHKDCFNKDSVFDAQNISGCLEDRCKELKSIAEENMNEIKEVLKEYEAVSSLAVKNKEKHEKLYTLIREHVIALTKAAADKKTKEDSELITKGKGILATIHSTIDEYTTLINEYNEVSKKVADKGIKELITAYQSLKTPIHGSWSERHEFIGKSISEFREKLANTEISYSEPAVKEALEKTFKNIHSEGTSERAEQGTSDFAFSLAPLSSLLCIYDLSTRFVKRKELAYGGKAYKVPYGAGVVQLTGKIFITGGTADLVKPSNICLEYSLFKDMLIARSSMCNERMEHGCVAVGDEIFCVGGRDEKGYLSSCERYSTNPDPFNPPKKWNLGPRMNESRSFPSLCAFKKDSSTSLIYAFGGLVGEKIVGKIECVCLTEETPMWKIVAVANPPEAYSMGCVPFRLNCSEGVLLLGGLKEGNQRAREAYFFDCNSPALKRYEELDIVKEEEYYYKPLIRIRGTQDVFAICQSQLWVLEKVNKIIKWKEIECTVMP